MFAKQCCTPLLLSAGVMLLTACTSSLKITRLNDAPLSETPSHKEIQFYNEGESAPADYKILGKVYAYKRSGTIFSTPSDKSMMKMMRAPAASLGADAIIGFRSSIFNGEESKSIRRWASGLAVRLGAPASPEDAQNDLLVVIAPPRFEKKQSEKNEAKFDKAMQDAAQWHLEQKGYYAILGKNALLPLTLGQIDSLQAEALYEYGDRRAGLILLLSLENVSSGHIGIAGGGDAQLSAKLLSKKTRKIVWENVGTGGTFTLGAVLTLGEDRKKNAIYAAMKHVFEPLSNKAEAYGVASSNGNQMEQ